MQSEQQSEKQLHSLKLIHGTVIHKNSKKSALILSKINGYFSFSIHSILHSFAQQKSLTFLKKQKHSDK